MPTKPLVVGLIAEFGDVFLGEAGQRLAVVELELLQPREPGVLGLFEPRQNRPHRGHLDRVRGDVLALDGVLVVVLFVDLLLVLERGDVRNVDLDRSIAQGLHELVVLQPTILRFVGVADDHFVDIGLGKFLRLDAVLLARTQAGRRETPRRA